MQTTIKSEQLQPRILVLIAVTQGFLLFWLKQAMADEFWPHEIRVAEVALWTLSLAVPTALLLSHNISNLRRLAPGIALYFGLIMLISIYIGWQLEPDEYIRTDLLFAFTVTQIILLFKFTMYLQIWSNRESLSYGNLFLYSWRNAILLGICLLFVLIVWGILYLWGALFDAIGISFFEDLFAYDLFLFPALALANGLAFCIFRRLENIVDTMARILSALCQFLLPLLSFVAILFLVCLPFVGLSELWGTGRGTMLVLWLQLLMLFFYNATYQDDDTGERYWRPLGMFVHAAILILPIYSLISIYGLWLRIDQYGLSVERCWAALLIFAITAFTFSYSLSMAKNFRTPRMQLGRINIGLGLLVLALMILVNTPLLDFRKLSVNSQIARYEADREENDLDLNYFSRTLARPGYLAMEELKQTADTALLARIEQIRDQGWDSGRQLTEADVLDMLQVYPATEPLPDKLQEILVDYYKTSSSGNSLHAFSVDLNQDGQLDWVIALRHDNADYFSMTLWTVRDANWTDISIRQNYGQTFAEFAAALEAGDIRVAPPEWQTLYVGETGFRVND